MKQITIEELEALLAEPAELDIEIQPDGSLKAVPKGTAVKHEVKVLSAMEFREICHY